jgi:hypothetical protein
MKVLPSHRFLSLILVGLLPSLVSAQDRPGAEGHWEGSLEVQGTKLVIAVDMTHKSEDLWTATIDIPAQGLKDSPLIGVVVKGKSVSFGMQGVPGDPNFTGSLSDDGNVLSGNMVQAGMSFPFRLERKGNVKAGPTWQQAYTATPSKGVPGTTLDGNWQGTLEAGGMSFRVILKVNMSADGKINATLDSPDQSLKDLAVDTIRLTEKHLTFEMNRIGAAFAGNMSQDGSEIVGEWIQGGGTLPLALKRLAKN